MQYCGLYNHFCMWEVLVKDFLVLGETKVKILFYFLFITVNDHFFIFLSIFILLSYYFLQLYFYFFTTVKRLYYKFIFPLKGFPDIYL